MEVSEPRVGAVTVGHVAAPEPLLVVASLAGSDEVDATTISFLLRENLWRKKLEEEKERRRVLEEEKAKAKAAEKEEAKMLKLSDGLACSEDPGDYAPVVQVVLVMPVVVHDKRAWCRQCRNSWRCRSRSSSGCGRRCIMQRQVVSRQ